MAIIRGKAWVAKTYVMSFDMIIQKYWTSPIDPEENSKWVMAGVDEAFNKENGFKNMGYTFIVAGHNFAGGGKVLSIVLPDLLAPVSKQFLQPVLLAYNFAML